MNKIYVLMNTLVVVDAVIIYIAAVSANYTLKNALLVLVTVKVILTYYLLKEKKRKCLCLG